jgi:hypothetical protein
LCSFDCALRKEEGRRKKEEKGFSYVGDQEKRKLFLIASCIFPNTFYLLLLAFSLFLISSFFPFLFSLCAKSASAVIFLFLLPSSLFPHPSSLFLLPSSFVL